MTDENSDAEESNTSPPLWQRIPWSSIAGVLKLALLLAVVLPFVVHAVPQLVGAEHSYVVLSGSMEPVMSPGDVVMIEDVDPRNLQEGDIITYARSGDTTPTTHRVIEIVEQNGDVAFRTKGDANEDPDQQLVPPGAVEGRVMTLGGLLLVIPYIGYVIQFTNTTLGFAALFVVPVALLVLSELYDIVTSASDDETDESHQSGADRAPAAGGSGSTAASETASDEPGAEETEGVTLTAAECQLGLVILGAFTLYSVWVAYQAITQFNAGELWASGVAASVGTGFLMLLGLYLTAGDSSDESEQTAGAEPPVDPEGNPRAAPEAAGDGGRTTDAVEAEGAGTASDADTDPDSAWSQLEEETPEPATTDPDPQFTGEEPSGPGWNDQIQDASEAGESPTSRREEGNAGE